MVHYIDKDALVVKINNLKHRIDDRYRYSNGWKDALCMLEAELNTLEVKEVDLEEAARKWEDKVYLEKGWQDSYGTPHAPFHEIGDAFIAGAEFMIKVQKGE